MLSHITRQRCVALNTIDPNVADSQLIDILLHGPTAEGKIQTVNQWCQNSRRRRRRLSTIVDSSQKYEIALALVGALEKTTNAESQYNCLTLLSELQEHLSHHDQRLYLPGEFTRLPKRERGNEILVV